MARLVIPADFYSQLQVLYNINTQNTNLGTASPLTAFLAQQGIVPGDDVNAASNAQTHETSRALLSRQSENYRQFRDNNFTRPWSHLTGCVQFLKQFYKGNTKELGNWGIAITDGGKINYPAAFIDRSLAFNSFTEKHNSYPAGTSPLQPYLDQQAIDLTGDAVFVSAALSNNNDFVTAAQQSENETELRNQLWQPVLEHIKTIGNFLMKLYSNNPKALGAWGFVVDNSPKKPGLRTSKVKPGETVLFNGLIIGGTLTNIGSGEIHVYRGKTTSGSPAIIHAGEQFGVIKGYSTITVVNPSSLIEGKFSVLTAQ